MLIIYLVSHINLSDLTEMEVFCSADLRLPSVDTRRVVSVKSREYILVRVLIVRRPFFGRREEGEFSLRTET